MPKNAVEPNCFLVKAWQEPRPFDSKDKAFFSTQPSLTDPLPK